MVVPVGRTGAVYMTTQDHPDYLPPSFDVSESGSPWPCHHDEGHIQYMCKVSRTGQRDLEMSIDADNRNLAWLTRSADGMRLDEYGPEERKVIEDYLSLASTPRIRGSSHEFAPLSARDTLVTCRLLSKEEHADDHSFLHKKYGFIHLIDVLSIMSVVGLALAASAIAAILGKNGDKHPAANVHTEEVHKRTRIVLGRNSIHFHDGNDSKRNQ
ncbi:hypothetical protein VNI00_002491 [Paramarasmius palmivorus]|uniref:Uncharacterized protein n=1 Tax=Paramarasmius palmivorus TaxID=297713 RepID=A0AAW0DUP1_9AGAR